MVVFKTNGQWPPTTADQESLAQAQRSGHLLDYVRAVQAPQSPGVVALSGEAGVSDPIEEFVQRWSLKAEAHLFLEAVSPEFQTKIMSQFAPRDTSRDVNAIFMKFATGIVHGVPQRPKGGVGRVSLESVVAASTPSAIQVAAHDSWSQDAPADGGGELEAFVERWALGAEAQDVLHSLDPTAQLRVMTEFRPRDSSSDVNNIFIKFAQGVATGKPRTGIGKGRFVGAEPATPQYAHHVAQAPVHVQQIRAPQTQAYQAQTWQPVRHPAPQTASVQAIQAPHGQGYGRRHDESSAYSHAISRVREAPVAIEANAGDSVEEFVQKWSLQADAQQFLEAVAPEFQTKIMTQFAPRDTSRDVNAIFMKFATGIVHGVPQKAKWHDGRSEVEAFATSWALGPEAQQILYSLDPTAQLRVMTEFSPRDSSSDVNNIFIKFAQGVASGTRRSGKGGYGSAPVSQYTHTWQPAVHSDPHWLRSGHRGRAAPY